MNYDYNTFQNPPSLLPIYDEVELIGENNYDELKELQQRGQVSEMEFSLIAKYELATTWQECDKSALWPVFVKQKHKLFNVWLEMLDDGQFQAFMTERKKYIEQASMTFEKLKVIQSLCNILGMQSTLDYNFTITGKELMEKNDSIMKLDDKISQLFTKKGKSYRNPNKTITIKDISEVLNKALKKLGFK